MKGRGAPSFKRRIFRLHEQIAWSHGPALGIKGNITIFYKQFGDKNFIPEPIHPLSPVFQDRRDTIVPEQMGSQTISFHITYQNRTYTFAYTYGILRTPRDRQVNANINRDPNRHIYPLTKYDKNPGSAGIDIIIGGEYGKRICRLSLNDVFGVGTSKLEYESYHGILVCPVNLPTSCLHNIKKKINKWNPIMQMLLKDITDSENITPEATCRSTPERQIHAKIEPLLKDRGHVLHEFPVNDNMEGLGPRSPLKADFMVEDNSGFYEIIEIAKALDLEHIYKMDAYRRFISLGLCKGIQWNMDQDPPDIRYTLVTPRPQDDFMLHYVEIYGFSWRPLSRYNINDAEIK
jgi:hypothetical protein